LFPCSWRIESRILDSSARIRLHDSRNLSATDGGLGRTKSINQITLRGEKWKVSTPKGKFRDITDREMVDISQQIQGWTQSVYRFGCAFVHLSDFHNHYVQNPFQRLTEVEKQDVLSHMRNYHGGPSHENLDMKEFSIYLPRVFDKIADNLKCYVEKLERGETSCD
jgi:hypothetical protein